MNGSIEILYPRHLDIIANLKIYCTRLGHCSTTANSHLIQRDTLLKKRWRYITLRRRLQFKSWTLFEIRGNLLFSEWKSLVLHWVQCFVVLSTTKHKQTIAFAVLYVH